MINPKELILIVDENNIVGKPTDRKEAHKNGIWHRSTNVWVINGNKILCQKRSVHKDTNPEKWEACFGGHLGHKDSYITAARREIEEEIGLQLNRQDLKQEFIYKYQNIDAVTGAIDREFLCIYTFNWRGDINSLRLEKEEIEEISWFTIQELKRLIGSNDNWINHGYEQDLLIDLENRKGP